MEKEISSIISSEKSSLNDLAELAKQDYNSFLNALEKNWKEEPLQLTFSTNLLNTNERAEKAINKVNPRDMFIETENKKVDGYYSALKNHTANELNMTEETYNNSIKYLASLKWTIDEYYSIKRTEYAWSTYLKDIEWNTVSKPLLTAAWWTNTETTVSASTDYSQYIKGIFIMSWDDVINAVNSEYNYEKFQSYYEKDLDKDWKTELIMRDSNHVFIKYFDNVKGSTWKTSVVVKPSLEDWKSSQYLTTRNWNLKVYDEISEIKNFKLNGQSYESIAFSRDNADGNISWYIMRLVERVDWFWEKNSKNNIKFILFLPNELEGETNNLKIRLPWETSPVNISSLIWSKIYSIKYYNSADDSLRVSLWEVPRRREYVQIASLKLDNTVYLKNSPWSNQLVWGRQVVWDWNAPTASVELLRSKKNDEVADIGFDLEWYVGTYYTLQITREDPTKVRVTKLEEYDSKNNTWKLLNEKDFDNFAGIIRLENLFFTWNQTKQYNISAVDSQGNETQETINLNIIIPWITIENVERQEGYKEGIKNPVSIVSELETDIDEWTVSFERNRNNITAPITSTTNWNQELTYEVTTNQTTVTGQYYDFWDEVGLYSKDNKLIATVDWENGNIEIKQEYASQTNIRVDFSQGYPIIKLMQWWIANFEILLQPESLVKVENAVWTTLTKLQGNNYWMFNWWDVLMKNKTPMLYIATNGTLYTTESLQGDYSFNAEDNTVTYKIYEPFSTTELVSVTFKVKPLE